MGISNRVLKNANLQRLCGAEIGAIHDAGTWKAERVLTTAQAAAIGVLGSSSSVINFCANNYLGLSSHAEVVQGATSALETRGAGLSSVRFICGTQDIHKELEGVISTYLERPDTILYPSCFDANAGVFEALLTAEDAVISDALNHASIIDGIRLCKAARYRYAHLDMEELEAALKATQDKRVRLIATDGVFSMDGDMAPLDRICALAERYNAAVFVDDCHATGFIGPQGRGTPHHFGVHDKVDLLHSTLGKAMGGASGGFSAGSEELVSLQRQRSRPYLFSNSLAPPVAGASLAAFKVLAQSDALLHKLRANTAQFRSGMQKAGFSVMGHPTCPIAPVFLGDARLASAMADAMLQKGVYVIGFSYPVVPKDQARIRVQLSAAHTEAEVDLCIKAFSDVRQQLAF